MWLTPEEKLYEPTLKEWDFIAHAWQLLEEVKFENYIFFIRKGHGGIYLRARYMEKDVYTTLWAKQYTRKWFLSPSMTDSEFIQTVFKLCATSMEHRLREHFTYKNARVFGPHFDVEDLVKLCRERENAGGRNPR